jgi:hypothetical protein
MEKGPAVATEVKNMGVHSSTILIAIIMPRLKYWKGNFSNTKARVSL